MSHTSRKDLAQDDQMQHLRCKHLGCAPANLNSLQISTQPLRIWDGGHSFGVYPPLIVSRP